MQKILKLFFEITMISICTIFVCTSCDNKNKDQEIEKLNISRLNKSVIDTLSKAEKDSIDKYNNPLNYLKVDEWSFSKIRDKKAPHNYAMVFTFKITNSGSRIVKNLKFKLILYADDKGKWEKQNECSEIIVPIKVAPNKTNITLLKYAVTMSTDDTDLNKLKKDGFDGVICWDAYYARSMSLALTNGVFD